MRRIRYYKKLNALIDKYKFKDRDNNKKNIYYYLSNNLDDLIYMFSEGGVQAEKHISDGEIVNWTKKHFYTSSISPSIFTK